jgi:hypothetical protein
MTDVLITKTLFPIFVTGIDEIHNLGCGLGYYLNLMNSGPGLKPECLFGYDISPSCTERAKLLFPDTKFSNVDLRETFKLQGNNNCRKLILLRGTIWYVVGSLEIVLNNIYDSMSKNDVLLISQNFPPFHSSYYGKSKLSGFGDLENCVGSRFNKIMTNSFINYLKSTNDNWFIGFFSK